MIRREGAGNMLIVNTDTNNNKIYFQCKVQVYIQRTFIKHSLTSFFFLHFFPRNTLKVCFSESLNQKLYEKDSIFLTFNDQSKSLNKNYEVSSNYKKSHDSCL